MIYLEKSQLIGRGTERECYRHPQNSSLCIKVTHNHENDKQQNAKDYAYFKRLERRRVDWSHLPRCHGWVETDRGPGLAFDLVQDSHAQPLPSLKQLLASKRLDLKELHPALDRLHRYLRDNRIFISDLRDSNIVADIAQPGTPNLYIIDGVGDRDFIKLAAHVAPLGRRKVDRQWAHFMHRMARWQRSAP
ncbi:YrbL family protein [Halomonas sp. WWR20]